MEPPEALKRRLWFELHPGLLQPLAKLLESLDDECGVSLSGGPEWILDAQVDFHPGSAEPRAATARELFGLRHPLQPEEA